MPWATLTDAVWELLREALELYRDDRRAAAALHHHLERLGEPLRVAVTGSAAAGKSTLVNAIVGERVAPVQAAAGSQIFTWYEAGPSPRAAVHGASGSVDALAVPRGGGAPHLDLRRWQPGHVNEIVVEWPARTLRHLSLLDTPPLPDPATGDAVVRQVRREADVVLHLTPYLGAADLAFLRSDRDTEVGRAAPLGTVLVLSRGDEVCGGRIDALVEARRWARRQRHDLRLRSACLTVVAVSGLLGHAARTLSGTEYAALAAVAAAPREEAAQRLLSTDRFLGWQQPAPLDEATRRGLLDRFGIFGIRLSTRLIQAGCGTRTGLSDQLLHRSGLTDLRTLCRNLVNRGDVLKARSALVAIERAVRADARPGAGRLLARLEQALAGAHEFHEVRLAAALFDGTVTFSGELAAEAGRLTGTAGTGAGARLGLDEDTRGEDLSARAAGALARWRQLAANPLLTLGQRRAAAVVVRSCEGILDQLSRWNAATASSRQLTVS